MNYVILETKLARKIQILNITLTLSDLIVIFIIFSMSIIFTSLTIHKHIVYNTYAWDLGTYGQILRSTLEGKFMYHTQHLYVLPSGNYLFWHFTPIILLLLPIYALAPYATTLLIIKSFITFGSIYPLYLLNKKLTNNMLISILVSLTFVLYPLLHGALWFDFQHAIFIPLFFFLSEYLYITNRKRAYLLTLALLSLTAEQGALIATIISILHLFYKYGITKYLKPLQGMLINYTYNNLKMKSEIAISLVILIYFIIITLFLNYIQDIATIEETKDTMKAYSSFSILNYKGSTLLLPFYAITHPSDALNALSYDYVTKLIFIFLVFGVFLFLPLQTVYGLIGLLFITPYIFSNGLVFYGIGGHYPYYYIGFVFLALTTVIYNIKDYRNSLRILTSMFVIISLLLISMAPWSTLSHIFIEKSMAWYPIVADKPDQHMLALDKLVKIANDEELSLLVQNHVFTHTTQKSNVYVLPVYELYQYNKVYFDGYIDSLIDRVDLILLDLTIDPLAIKIYDKVRDKGFGIYAENHNNVLLKRDYTSQPILSSDMDCKNIIDNKNLYSYDNIRGIKNGKKGFLNFGQYRFMFEGNYLLRYSVRADSIDTFGAIGFIDVVSNRGTQLYAKKFLSGYEVNSNWHNITLPFSVTDRINDMEFRLYSLGKADLEFKDCKIERIENVTEKAYNMGIKDELLFNIGFKDNELITLPKGFKTDIFWYSPRLTLSKGVYFAEIYLKIEPSPTSRVIDISILYNIKSKTVTTIAVDQNKLFNIGDNWYIIRMPFILNEDVKDLEIVGNNPNSNYTITISHINIQGI